MEGIKIHYTQREKLRNIGQMKKWILDVMEANKGLNLKEVMTGGVMDALEFKAEIELGCSKLKAAQYFALAFRSVELEQVKRRTLEPSQ